MRPAAVRAAAPSPPPLPEPDLPLGEEWLGCRLVWRAGEIGALPAGAEAAAVTALGRHLEEYPAAAHRTVWLDRETGTCFSAAQRRGDPCGKDYNFLAEPEDFLGGLWGERYVRGAMAGNPTFRRRRLATGPELVYGRSRGFARLAGKRVLLVLGGPTTKRLRWDEVGFDRLWSCNKFYLSPRVARHELDLVALAADVPLGEANPALHRYLERRPTRIAFEAERGGPVGDWGPVHRFVRRYGSRCDLFHTRYQSALGLGTRLLLLAILLGAREIAFVGLDGMSERGPLHAFEPYKANPRWYDRFGPALQRRQYVVFWEYVLALRERYGFHLLNLGEVSAVNQSREISLRHFPLPAEIRRAIL